MNTGIKLAILMMALSAAIVLAAPGDYDPAYDQGAYGTDTLDVRVAKLEKQLSGGTLLEMLNRVEQLQGDALRLRGDVEDLTHQLETLKKQQKDLYQDLDQRLRAATPPPPAPAPAPAAPPAGNPDAAAQPPAGDAAQAAAPPPKPVAPPPPPPETAARQAAYQKAFNILKEGKYPEAIKEFKVFLAAYPKGEYVDNALYWLAEAHYVNRDFPASREAFRKLVKDFPQGSKMPDALLKLGYIDYDTGQWISARESLNDVIKRYPDSSAAKMAEKRLAKMKQEGH
jgi:tol-pal system protein YbgF